MCHLDLRDSIQAGRTKFQCSSPSDRAAPASADYRRHALLARYLLAESADTLYVAFMGTKFRRDLVTNANVFMEPIWPDELDQPSAAAAHRGYLGRARGIPIEQIYEFAASQGRRLVLCGVPPAQLAHA